jgi:hypothetical protein
VNNPNNDVSKKQNGVRAERHLDPGVNEIEAMI